MPEHRACGSKVCVTFSEPSAGSWSLLKSSAHGEIYFWEGNPELLQWPKDHCWFMEMSHILGGRRKVFLLGRVEILQDVQWSGLCMVTLVTAGETGSTWEGRALKLEAASL